jgi:hypothetical protein
MRSYYSFVKIIVQTKAKKKITFSLDKLSSYAECVNISLVDSVDCLANKLLGCTSINDLCEQIINFVDLSEIMELYGGDSEMMDIIQDKIATFSKKMQTIDALSDISHFTITEETVATGEYAVGVSSQWCNKKLSKEIIKQACDSSAEFEKIEHMIFDSDKLAVFNAAIATTIYYNGSKTEVKWKMAGETAYGQDDFALKGSMTVKKPEVESWDVFDDIDRSDSNWLKWINWVLRELAKYNEKLSMEINLDFDTYKKMETRVPPGSENRKLMLYYPYVFLKAEEGDELACRFASIFKDLKDIL